MIRNVFRKWFGSSISRRAIDRLRGDYEAARQRYMEAKRHHERTADHARAVREAKTRLLRAELGRGL